MKRENPKVIDAFTKVGLVLARFRDLADDATVSAVALSDGGAEHLTYGHLRELQAAAFEAGDRLQRIAAWHSREAGPVGTGSFGSYCIECGELWPCETRRMADGTHEDLTE